MKFQIYLLTFVLLLECEFTRAQTGWFNLNSGVVDGLNSIYFANENSGFCVGELGRIIKTTNGGSNWDTLSTNNYGQNINSVCFVNYSTGFVAGTYNVYKTENSGINWTLLPSFGNHVINAVYFWNPALGFILTSGKILRTTNIGMSWDSAVFSDSYHFTCIDFYNQSSGFIGGLRATDSVKSVIFKTTDGGLNWYSQPEVSCIQFISIKSFIGNILYSLSVDCTNNLFEYKFGKSSNGGISWLFTSFGNTVRYRDLFFTSINTGYLVGDYGIILKTNNAGQNWYNQTQGQGGPNLNSIQFINDSIGYVCGGNGRIKKTTNGGGPIGVKLINSEVPIAFKLCQNYPNPFNPVTKIRFDIPLNSRHRGNDNVVLKVYDILGKEITTLVNQSLRPGIYEVDFSGTNYPSGVYFCRLIAEDFSRTIKMILLK